MPDLLWLSLTGIGTALGVAGVLWRNKEIKNARHMLRQAKQEVREIAELPLNNPHPVLQVTAQGVVTFANQAAIDAFPDVVEQGFEHPVLRGLLLAAKQGTISTRDVDFGDLIYHQTIASTKAQESNAFIVYFYDITQRRKYEIELEHAHRLAEGSRQIAEQANRARGDFLANMSHELRTPMNGIIGLSDMLVDADLNKEHQELIEAVNSSARNLLILLNDILDFSKIEAGELTIEKIAFDIRRVVQQIEKLQRPLALQKGLELKSQTAADVPQHLMGDPARLQQMLNNLIGNALKFTKQGGVTISVSGKYDAEQRFILCISVIDTGIGIPEAKQKEVFIKFRQADVSTSREYGGTGLGLAITKDLAALMGGEISLQSQEGKGSVFSIILPLDVAPMQQSTLQENGTAQIVQKQTLGLDLAASVLIVDDHPVNLLFMEKMFSKAGFQNYDLASSGKQALELMEHKTYDLILMDCQMPEMDGFEASRLIRDNNKAHNDPTIIAVTADAMKGAEDKCLAAGMDDYVSKPVDKERLFSVLRNWIPGDGSPIMQQIENESGMGKINEENQDIDIFNWNQLNEYTEGDAALEEKFLTMFFSNLKNDVDKLEHEFSARDFHAWDAHAHKLFGAASHIGATSLAKISGEAQQALVRGQEDEIPALHAQILTEYKRLLLYFQNREV